MSESELQNLYLEKKYSVAQIAKIYGCSEGRINYWLQKWKVPKRTISDAIYLNRNPQGDPFKVSLVRIDSPSFLYGLGLGLYWGEGTKSNKHSIRLGNTDPRLIKKFLELLITIYGIDRTRLQFGLQIFSDMNPEEALRFWQKTLGVQSNQFYRKVVVTESGKIGTYRNKTKHGVLTVYFNNKKLRNILCQTIENL